MFPSLVDRRWVEHQVIIGAEPRRDRNALAHAVDQLPAVAIWILIDCHCRHVLTMNIGKSLTELGDEGQECLHTAPGKGNPRTQMRSEEHTSELQSPYHISYAVFCLDRKSVV